MPLNAELNKHVRENYKDLAEFSEASGVPLSSLKKYTRRFNAQIPAQENKEKIVGVMPADEQDKWKDLLLEETIKNRGNIEADEPFLLYHVAKKKPFQDIVKDCYQQGKTELADVIRHAIDEWQVSTKAFAAVFDVAGSTVEKILVADNKLKSGDINKKKTVTQALVNQFTENDKLSEIGISSFDSETRNLLWAMANGDKAEPDIRQAVATYKDEYNSYKSLNEKRDKGLQMYKSVMKHYNFGDLWVSDKTGGEVKEERVNYYRNSAVSFPKHDPKLAVNIAKGVFDYDENFSRDVGLTFLGLPGYRDNSLLIDLTNQASIGADELVYTIRVQNGLTKEEFAQKVGTQAGVVDDWEAGRKGLSTEIADKIAENFLQAKGNDVEAVRNVLQRKYENYSIKPLLQLKKVINEASLKLDFSNNNKTTKQEAMEAVSVALDELENGLSIDALAKRSEMKRSDYNTFRKKYEFKDEDSLVKIASAYNIPPVDRQLFADLITKFSKIIKTVQNSQELTGDEAEKTSTKFFRG